MRNDLGLLFSGQGSQYIGMGKDIYERYDYIRDLFSEANQLLDYNLEEIIFKENSLINQTRYTQTSVLIVTIALFEVFKREYQILPLAISGFSLGEYSALYASGIYNLSEIIQLVNYRANYMESVAKKTQGSMAAIIGLDEVELNKVCQQVGGVWIANYNSPKQLVISGYRESVGKALGIVQEKYKKRGVLLNVSGAFHSPLMREAALEFAKVLGLFTAKEPRFPLIMNYNAKELEFSKLDEALVKQIYSPVYFRETIIRMITEYKVNEFVEIGPGKTLSGLVRQIDREKKITNIENLEDIIKFKEIR